MFYYQNTIDPALGIVFVYQTNNGRDAVKAQYHFGAPMIPEGESKGDFYTLPVFKDKSQNFRMFMRMLETAKADPERVFCMDHIDWSAFSKEDKRRIIEDGMLGPDAPKNIAISRKVLDSIRDNKSVDKANIEDLRTNVYVMCGLPGSGKSTWIKENLPGVRIVSRDVIRYELGFTSSPDEKRSLDPEQEKEVSIVEMERIRDLCRQRKSFVIDDTNLFDFRGFFMEGIKENMPGAHLVGINMNTPVEDCIRRREGQIGENYFRTHEFKPLKYGEVDEIRDVTFRKGVTLEDRWGVFYDGGDPSDNFKYVILKNNTLAEDIVCNDLLDRAIVSIEYGSSAPYVTTPVQWLNVERNSMVADLLNSLPAGSYDIGNHIGKENAHLVIPSDWPDPHLEFGSNPDGAVFTLDELPDKDLRWLSFYRSFIVKNTEKELFGNLEKALLENGTDKLQVSLPYQPYSMSFHPGSCGKMQIERNEVGIPTVSLYPSAEATEPVVSLRPDNLANEIDSCYDAAPEVFRFVCSGPLNVLASLNERIPELKHLKEVDKLESFIEKNADEIEMTVGFSEKRMTFVIDKYNLPINLPGKYFRDREDNADTRTVCQIDFEKNEFGEASIGFKSRGGESISMHKLSDIDESTLRFLNEKLPTLLNNEYVKVVGQKAPEESSEKKNEQIASIAKSFFGNHSGLTASKGNHYQSDRETSKKKELTPKPASPGKHK